MPENKYDKIESAIVQRVCESDKKLEDIRIEYEKKITESVDIEEVLTDPVVASNKIIEVLIPIVMSQMIAHTEIGIQYGKDIKAL